MKEKGQEFRERMNYYITTEGKYIGTLVNIPGVISQADNLEELEKRCKAAMKTFIIMFQEALELPFESVEVTKEKFL